MRESRAMSAAGASTRLLSLVFTDLAGSTALKAERGDAAGSALVGRHRQHVGHLATELQGRVVDFAGDGAFLAFEAPSAAVLFALRLQALHAAEPALPAVRIGVHLGEVGEREGRVEGIAVDLASRVQSLARPGQILVSGAAASAARPRSERELLGRAVRWQSHGAYLLKGSAEPLEIVEVGLAGSAPFAAPEAGEKARPARRGASPALARALLGGAVLLALAAVASAVWWAQQPASDAPLAGDAAASATNAPTTAATPIRSLAVLPLANLSGDPEQEFFADGMTETLITELAKLPGVRVISRTSVMQFKGTKTPLREIAKALNVEGVIEGSVMRAGGEVRITTQLIDARSDAHVWAEQYDRELARVLEIQREVAKAVAAQISIALTPQQTALLATPKPVDPRAQDAYFRAQILYDEYRIESMEAAARELAEALRIAPDWAAARAFHATVITRQVFPNRTVPRSDGLPRAREEATRAIALDPTSGDAYAALGLVETLDWNWAAAESAFEAALERGRPAAVFDDYAVFLTARGRCDEALRIRDEAVATSPASLPPRALRAFNLVLCDRLPEAQAVLDALPPTESLGPALLPRLWIAELTGRFDEAIAVMRQFAGVAAEYLGTVAELERAHRDGGAMGYWRARAAHAEQVGLNGESAGYYAQLGDRDRAFEWLERGFEAKDPSVLMLTTVPYLKPLRSDPRFADLARRMRLPAPQP
jgi:TolB-like protein/class 3 adenylate cyclase